MDSRSLSAHESHDRVDPAGDEEIVARYSSLVYKLAYTHTRSRHDADDIFQEVFLRYVKARPVFESDEHGKAWFIRVTENCSRSFLTSSWFRRSAPLPEDDSLVCEQPEDSGVREAVMALPEAFRAVIFLFYYEDMPTEKIAAALGISSGTVRMRLTRARRMLKGILSEEGDQLN